MKKFAHTKATVRLRPVEFRDKQWYVYIESYPVYESCSSQPQRKRDYTNRIVTTVVWDKNGGSKRIKPKRDANGLIVCRSEADKQTILYADGIRKERQREYDNADLYSDTEKQAAQQKERSQQNFIEYFVAADEKLHPNCDKSTKVNWKQVHNYLKQFAGEVVPFSNVNRRFGEDFMRFLLTAKAKRGGIISNNTARLYFDIFKASLKQAFKDEYLTIDIARQLDCIRKEETRREFLTLEELQKLRDTPCKNEQLKRAAFFSALTGLRHCDISKLQWKEIQIDGEHVYLNFTQQKTKGVERHPISTEAYKLCGDPRNLEDLVFDNLPKVTSMRDHLDKWISAAGITRNITFHCFRHTFATLQLAEGTDIYTVSKMLGHTDIKTTQIYAKVVDATKRKAANAIKLDI